ncbi:thioesterase family protein [Fulvivirga sp. 29W222]|uniref:Thioesterase family protein n=1 Tax=Fulvivirga marina TaxID=2494733 RepID=A0A937KC44_9BACT|nr:thioesterase family protein [Fulvivirga marina]MBL6444858.1 thioesterase family protein [Fulvivirga marina]
MARIKLNFPNKVQFTTELTIRVNDLNYGGHVGNDSILTLMHEARFQFLRSLGYKDELTLGGDIGIIVSDVAIVYKSESFYGDHITIEVAIDDFNKYGFDMYYSIKNKQTGKEVATGKTGIICINYSERKIAHVPKDLLAALQV